MSMRLDLAKRHAMGSLEGHHIPRSPHSLPPHSTNWNTWQVSCRSLELGGENLLPSLELPTGSISA